MYRTDALDIFMGLKNRGRLEWWNGELLEHQLKYLDVSTISGLTDADLS